MNIIETFIPKDTTSLLIELGWDHKENTAVDALKGMVENLMSGSSEHTYDLNLAAIIEYTNEKKPELVFHSHDHHTDSNDAILLSKDSRTGAMKVIDETIKINLVKLPYSTKRITLFVNISEGSVIAQDFPSIPNVFVQAVNKELEKTYWREEEAFSSEEAKGMCNYAFAELVQAEGGWTLRRINDFSKYDNEVEFFENFTK